MSESLYTPGKNCYRKDKATRAAALVDCAAYYRALHYAIANAKESIFVLGWDIDGRIELLRGEEAEQNAYPAKFFDLIKRKAEENPDIKIYLNRWNYSIFFSKEREAFSGWKWHMRTPPNVFYCADYKIQFTGCHHQKIIVVDDEIAFCGGMDIALGRWDKRQHYVRVKERVDPGGMLTPFKPRPYGPYHDIQFVLNGPAVNILATIVRDRWKKGAGFHPIPLENKNLAEKKDAIWPTALKPLFEDIEIAVARTLPETGRDSAVKEILNAYLDEISQAESFIYIENQYITEPDIARAIAKRLREKPDLRVLAVSSDHPRGFMEHRAMWSGRVDFCNIISDAAAPQQYAITYPITTEGEKEETIHIHSKLMIVDDKFMHIGSSNLNRRSMGFDTECDVLIQAENDYHRKSIKFLRNNLIREHTGKTEEEIENLIESHAPIEKLIAYKDSSRQHLMIIDNAPYQDIAFQNVARAIGDPANNRTRIKLPFRQLFYVAVIGLLLGGLYWAWLNPVFADFFTKENILNTVEAAQNSSFSVLWIIALYLVAGILFLPITVLNLTTAIVFGPVLGIFYALIGSMASAFFTYAIGFYAGNKAQSLLRGINEKIHTYADKGGVLGMTLIRLIPIAPFTVVNLTFGMAHIAAWQYGLSTFFGLLPGVVAKGVFGGAVGHLWDNPDPQVIFYVMGSLLLWLGIIYATNHFARKYKQELQI